MRLTRFFRLKESVRQLQAREGIDGLAFRLKEEPFRIDPAELVFGQTGIFNLTASGSVTRVVLYDSEQRVDSENMDPLLRANVVSGGFDNDSLIERLPRFHLLLCDELLQLQDTQWRMTQAWQISHRANSRFIFSYTTNSGVLCDMDTQRLLPCAGCITAMNELGYMKNSINDSGHLLALLNSQDFYTRQQTPRPTSCTSVPKSLWADWALLSNRYQSMHDRCANSATAGDTGRCDNTSITAHYSQSDINRGNFHYLTGLCHTCHTKTPGHEYLRDNRNSKA